MSLYVQSASVLTLASAPLYVHLVTQDWDPNATTWTRRTASLNWTTAGGTYTNAVLAETNFSSLVAGSWVVFELPIASVSNWIATPSSNFGVLLKRSADGDPGQAYHHNKVTFATSEHTNATLRPKLEITYTASGNQSPLAQISSPETGTAALADGALSIQANATDRDGSIARVDFLSGSTILGSDTAAPYSFRWQHAPWSTNINIIARAYDNSGSNTDSATIPLRIQSTIYSANMSTNPTWTLDSDWQFGRPSGYYVANNSTDDGDPASGFTGTNVIGYRFSGLLPVLTNVVGARTPAINCSNYSNVILSFSYWLGIGERYNNFKAGVDISTNGADWTSLWTNPNERMTAGVWRRMVLNISSFANGKPAIYLRWTHGPGTNYPFCGWNLDDVEVAGTPPPVVLADADVDGLPDSWEMAFLGTTNYPAGSDPNGVGATLMQSYLSGMSPTNRTDITKLKLALTNSETMYFDAFEAGTNYYKSPRYYSLDFKTNLLAGSWLGVPSYTNILAENQRIFFTNTLPREAFYRFRIN